MKQHTAIPVVALALMVCAPAAYATTVTSSEGPTPTLSASAEGGHVVFDNPIAKVECSSSMEGKVETHGEGVPVSGSMSVFSFANCTNNWHVTGVTPGTFEIESIGAGDGKLTLSGVTFSWTRFGIPCHYLLEDTDIGTLTDGTHATLDITASIPFHSGSGLCGLGAMAWTGSYKFSGPTNLKTDP
jgi:hypothetical protein